MLDDLPAWAAIRAEPRRVVQIGVALAAVAFALWWLFRPPPPIAPEQVLPVVSTTPDGAAVSVPGVATAPSPAPAATPDAPPSTVVVHVAGAVARPGVLRLPVGARVIDAIDAAGGPSGDADSARINLAAPVADGGWIYVPSVGEDVPAAPPPSDGGAASSGTPARPSSDEPVDLNGADAPLLDTLPGVGPATAAAIIEHRTRNGPFTSVDGLADVPGIGPAKLERLRPLVRV